MSLTEALARGPSWPVGRRADDGGVPGPVAALAVADEHGRPPRRARFGPNRGSAVTYTNPHRWLPGFRPNTGDAALRCWSGATCIATARPRPSTSPGGSASRRGAPSSCSPIWRARWSRSSTWTARRRTLAGDTETPQPHRGIRLLGYFDAFVVAS